MRAKRRGYILVETITAMAILSITAITAQRAIQVAIQARGLAQDYATAQLLLENLVADQSLQPRISLGAHEAGTFPAPYERFQYVWHLDPASIPFPEIPPGLPPGQVAAAEQSFIRYMGRLQVSITWSRAGQAMEIEGDTLLHPGQVWIPPEMVLP